MPETPNTTLDFAHLLADEARSITLDYFRRPLQVTKKSNETPVTVADQTTESRLRQLIELHYPDHSIIGEEHAEKSTQSTYQWVIDPIDGTKNFVAGIPLFTTLIALFKSGQPILSLIDAPAQDERWIASKETPTTYQRQQTTQLVRTRDTTSLDKAILCSTDLSMFSDAENAQVQPLRDTVSLIRYNGDAYLYAMLASGWIDLVLESDLQPYDFLPLRLIVEQAGGSITDWQGNPLTRSSCGQVLASANATLHQQALDKIRQTIQPQT
ncbi:histidinol-phosphatase [Ostreibacterium oceani]|nr:histidinol-phosphatase [Ostreibacterium oceani]